jgi:hypothetical protein
MVSHGHGSATLADLQTLLLFTRLDKALVETTDPIANCCKREAFKDISFLRGEIQQTLGELVVILLLLLGVVERIAALQILESMIDQVGF